MKYTVRLTIPFDKPSVPSCLVYTKVIYADNDEEYNAKLDAWWDRMYIVKGDFKLMSKEEE